MSPTAFAGIDYFILILYMVGVTFLGAAFYGGQKNLKDYTLAGRSVPWFFAAVSILATDFSISSYCGVPAYVFQNDLKLFFTSFSVLLATPLVIRFFLPVYARFNVFTAYEYLEKRFDVKTRLFTSFVFLLVRGGYVGVVVYAPSLILSVVTGWRLEVCVLLMGAFTTLYTFMGGMKAVIWTDFVQFGVVVLALVAILRGAFLKTAGGLSAVWQIAGAHGRLRLFDFSLDPRATITFWGALIGGTFWVLNSYGTDQMIIQRYLTTRSEKASRRALLTNAALGIPVAVVLYLMGILLYVFYYQRPASLAGLAMPDGVVPYFTVHELPHGLSGLVIASIFAAGMSPMSSGINSLTTVTVVDFYKRLWRPGEHEAHYLRAARWITVAWGAAVTTFALFAKNLGELAIATAKVNSFLGGIPLGVFIIGMFTRRVNGGSAIAGALIGLSTVAMIGLTTTVSWMWYAMIGCLVTFCAAYTLSWMTGQRVEVGRPVSELAGRG